MMKILTREELECDDNIDRLIRIKECEWLAAISHEQRISLEKKGQFPARIIVGPKMIVYRLSEIQAWIKGTWKPE